MNSGMDSSLRARVRCLVLVFCSVPGGVGVYPNLIAVGVLGPVKRHVGGREQLEQVVAVLAEHATPIETVTLMRAAAAATLVFGHQPRNERTISLRTDMSSLQTDMPVRGGACRGAARMATL